MENKNFRHFKDDIKRTFILYALIPVLTITFIAYLISFSMLYRSVTTRNQTINSEISKRIDSVVSRYIDKAIELESRDFILVHGNNGNYDTKMYEELYGFVNKLEVRGNFFIFDAGMKPLIASSTNIPGYARPENAFNWGAIKRMTETPDKVVLLKTSSDPDAKQTFTVGKAMVKGNRIIGYIAFDLNQKDLTNIISENFSINVVITDMYGNVVSATNSLLVNKFNKIDDHFKNRNGFIKTENDRHYVTRTEILDHGLKIYTITSVGHYESIFIIVGIILIVLFCILTAAMLLSAGRIADSKTKVIDEIVDAIGNVQEGKLDTMLKINTNDEFQIIAESYNKMLGDIKELIELNREKAKQSVLSEIKQLESQFNPHFLFNTLEMIKYMSKMEPASANKIIVALSTLLRYSINNNISKVTLGEDLEYTKNYLLIQKYRFGKQFDFSINVEEGTSECIVPKLIIQPIIENAIKYGFDSKKDMVVCIKASFIEEKLVIVIYDNGVGMDAGHLEEIQQIIGQSKNKSSHIGLFNVHRRIQLTYGNNYGVQILSEKNSGTVVKITLPIDRSDRNAESADS